MRGPENSYKEMTEDKVPVVCSKRWILAYISMLGLAILYALRVNMSVAIVCMVRSTKEEESSDKNNTESNQCGNLHHDQDENRGEFDWDKSTQSIILSSFYYGYIATPIAGGLISDKVGGKFVLGGGILITSLANILIPMGARLDFRMVVIYRVIMGLAEGVVFSSLQSLWGRWAPSRERSRLISFTHAGLSVGNIVTFMVSGLLCAEGFDNGWGSVFYVTGGAGLVWCAAWFYLVSSSPDTHPTISKAERDYINQSIAKDSVKNFKVPWRSLLTSRAVWACAIAHTCNMWLHTTVLAGLPSFMKEVLKFDIKKNGLLSAIPYIASGVSSVSIGHIADYVRGRWLSTKTTRRLIQVISFLGSGSLLVAVGFVSCENRMIAVVLLTLMVGCEGMMYAGYMANHVDFAPAYAGVTFGVTKFVSTIPGIITPFVIGALTPNKTQEEWQNVFYVCGGFTLVGAIVYGGLAQGETQAWARDQPDPSTSDDKSGTEKGGKLSRVFNFLSGTTSRTDKGGKPNVVIIRDDKSKTGKVSELNTVCIPDDTSKTEKGAKLNTVFIPDDTSGTEKGAKLNTMSIPDDTSRTEKGGKLNRVFNFFSATTSRTDTGGKLNTVCIPYDTNKTDKGAKLNTVFIPDDTSGTEKGAKLNTMSIPDDTSRTEKGGKLNRVFNFFSATTSRTDTGGKLNTVCIPDDTSGTEKGGKSNTVCIPDDTSGTEKGAKLNTMSIPDDTSRTEKGGKLNRVFNFFSATTSRTDTGGKLNTVRIPDDTSRTEKGGKLNTVCIPDHTNRIENEGVNPEFNLESKLKYTQVLVGYRPDMSVA